MAITAQGLGARRPLRPAGRASLAKLLDRIGTIQLDAVNVLARTQYLVCFSRVGEFDPSVMESLSRPGGPWFEYWGHAASLLPVGLHPLFRWKMLGWRDDQVDSPQVQARRRAWRAAHRDYLQRVLDEVTDRGPLAASQLTEPRRRSGEWWGRRSDGRRALELLFGDGVLAAWRSSTFERLYDLSDRVIPPEVLALPTPSTGEAQRRLILLAARCMGVATAADLADYFWIKPPAARTRVAELVEDKKLTEVEVEGWGKAAYALPGRLEKRLRRAEATLLSPFDSLVWTRARAERLFGFRYRIEIYVPSHRRTHGYYVLPVLLGDALVGRLDLKADRAAGTLRVVGAFIEPDCDPEAVVPPLLDELGRLRQWLGLSRLAVGDRGNLTMAIRRAHRDHGDHGDHGDRDRSAPGPG
jgi:uncharacterized protein